MNKINNKRLEKIGLQIPRILMPSPDVDMQKWAVVACDQYTSELEYWEDVSSFVGNTPSTLNLIYPECYLEEKNPEERIARINSNMEKYLKDKILTEKEPGFILVERSTGSSSTRYGLMAAMDLEAYDYSKDSTSLIRATEGTILERIPPRKRIRINAPVELPHILVLLDDEKRTVIEPLVDIKDKLPVVYNFDLMKDGGKIKGYMVSDNDLIENIVSSLEKLADPDSFKRKYNRENVLLFAIGDGNHSLATAKATWEEIKKDLAEEEKSSHPARYALVELENIFDEGITFEPIHRVLFNISRQNFFDSIKNTGDFSYEKKADIREVMKIIETQSGDSHKIGYCDSESCGVITLVSPEMTIPAGSAQLIIDSYLEADPDASVDYIHGSDVTEKLGSKEGNCGIFLPAVKKNDFFRTVIRDSAFPRKTFSMGEAHEKRFYVEARKIR